MAYFVLKYFTVFVITSATFGSGTVFTVCLFVNFNLRLDRLWTSKGLIDFGRL